MIGTVLMLFFGLPSITHRVLHVNQHLVLPVEEAHDLKLLEHEAAVLVKDALAALKVTHDLDWADLTTGNAGVTRVLRQAHFPFTPPVCARAM